MIGNKKPKGPKALHLDQTMAVHPAVLSYRDPTLSITSLSASTGLVCSPHGSPVTVTEGQVLH